MAQQNQSLDIKLRRMQKIFQVHAVVAPILQRQSTSGSYISKEPQQLRHRTCCSKLNEHIDFSMVLVNTNRHYMLPVLVAIGHILTPVLCTNSLTYAMILPNSLLLLFTASTTMSNKLSPLLLADHNSVTVLKVLLRCFMDL